MCMKLIYIKFSVTKKAQKNWLDLKNIKLVIPSKRYQTIVYVLRFANLWSPSNLEINPKIWANEFGMIPRKVGSDRTPSIVNVFPVPVWP